jgi:hypothetical protein
MKTKRTKVVIPHKVIYFSELVNKIYEKHKADGADSLLKLIAEHTDVDSFKDRIEHVMQYHEEAERLRREMEMQYELRDIWMKPLVKEVRNAAQFLKSFHTENNFTICLWGYEVNHSTPTKKKKTNPTTES